MDASRHVTIKPSAISRSFFTITSSAKSWCSRAAIASAWLTFLQLLGRSPRDCARGRRHRLRLDPDGRAGISSFARSTTAKSLRERRGLQSAAWEEIVSNCLDGMATFSIDDKSISELLGLAYDADRVMER